MSQSNTSNKKTGLIVTTAILGLLLLAAIGTLIHYSKQSDTYTNKTQKLETELAGLQEEKLGLEAEISQLNTFYENETTKNAELEAKIQDTEEKVNSLKNRIYTIKKQLSAAKISNQEMQERISELHLAKEELIAQIAALETDKADLTTAQEGLSVELLAVNDENSQLTARIEELTLKSMELQQRLFNLAPAGFQATGFQIQVADRKDKLTAKARQAKEVKINFELLNVPKTLQKEQDIYLVVTDSEGVPVPKITTTPVNVPTSEGILKVEVANRETIALGENQKMSLAFQPTDQMDAGLYNVALWSNTGYLGSAAFSLR